MGLRLAMFITFMILGVLLTSVFWIAAWFFGLTGNVLLVGVILFVCFMVFFQWLIGPAIIKRSVRMHECKDQRILATVHSIAVSAGIPKPRVYLVDNPVPNAFAFGRTQKSSNIALHTGLLDRLSEEEVRAVIAHEIGHIKHRDVIVMTLASALPAILFYLIYFGVMMAGSRDRGGGMNYLGAWAGGMIAQFLATLLVLYLSRVREYSADSFSAKSTRRPNDLASALAKISYSLSHSKQPTPATMRSFYIADEISSKYSSQMEHEKKRGWMELFMTHPLTYKRIKALERIR
jgi:heat shock protein HtpX